MLHGCLISLFIPGSLADLNIVSALAKVMRPLDGLPTNNKDFIQFAAENGYKAEKHEVTTDDGYILTVHRIPPGSKCTKKTPLLLVHGLLQSDECFLDSGPDAPGFVLAHECYDVWFGNVRGNYYSRKHVTLDPDRDLGFWKFSVDEIGQLDIPAMIDYVLDATNAKKLNYIGYSQGGGSFFIMNSEKPEYVDKINLFIGLAPATRLYYTKSVLDRLVVNAINSLQGPLEASGIWEVTSRGLPIQGTLEALCRVPLLTDTLGNVAVSAIDSSHLGSMTPETFRRIFEHVPAGTSIQNLAWYGQAMNELKFLKFNYGSEENLKVYGVAEPPEYDLGKTTMPVVIFHGKSDHIVDTRDLDWVVSRLPNVLEYVTMADPLWNHFDMVFSQYWKKQLFTTMETYLNTSYARGFACVEFDLC
ncbi:lipase 1-like [Cydia strobilella]|uniref:lipase 1-like n=1 Tax=Cydia strobilella TaxID=1100964 RepID=UPI003006CFE4